MDTKTPPTQPPQRDAEMAAKAASMNLRAMAGAVRLMDDGEDGGDGFLRVELSFASEEPYQRWDGQEILRMSGCDLTRLNAGGQVLFNHWSYDYIGVVEKAWVDTKAKKGMCLVRFSNDPMKAGIVQDIKDGILSNVSVGYRVLERKWLKEVPGKSKESIYECSKWEPLEVSIVTVPADATVGVGRGLILEAPATPDPESVVSEEEGRSATVDTNQTPNLDEVRQQERAQERERVSAITKLAKQHNHMESLAKWIEDGTTPDQVRAAILDAQTQRSSTTRVDGTQAASQQADPASVKKEAFNNFGDFLRQVHHAAKHGPTEALREHEARMANEARERGLNSLEGADGGFAIPTTFINELLRVTYEQGQIMSRVRKLPTGTGSYRIPAIDEVSRKTGSRFGGVNVYWVAEGKSVTDTQPVIRPIDGKVEDLMARVNVTNDLIDDAPMMNGVITSMVATEIVSVVEDAILFGDGQGKPLGIMNSSCLVSVAKESGQAAASITVTNLRKMLARMYPGGRTNALWLVDSDLEAALVEMTIGNQPVYLPPGGVADAPYGRLFGRPVIVTEYNNQLGTKGDIILADLSQYLYIERGGVKADQSMHVKFDTNEMAYRFVTRCNGHPWWRTSVEKMKGTLKNSCFVTLDERA